MSATEKSRVTSAESLEITGRRVGVYLEKLLEVAAVPFELSNSAGMEPFGPHETTSYSIVEKQNLSKLVRFLDKITATMRARKIVASIWFSNEVRRATHKKWVLEVFGRDNLKFFEQIAEDLAKQFDVDIHVRLCSEEPQYSSLFGYY
jgi:hypothetical protein